jgi:putative transposase
LFGERGAHLISRMIAIVPLPVAATVAAMNIQAVRTAPRAPWQNADAERVIGSIRCECLDHVIVANATGLHRVLTSYVRYRTDR